MKKLFMITLTALILIACASSALADSTLLDSGECGKYGDNLIWEINRVDRYKILTIRKNGVSGEMADFLV